MPNILPTEIPCVQLTAGPGELCIELPGGIKHCASANVDLGNPAAIVRAFMADVNSALTPLAPFFQVMDVVKAIVDCVEAIPDAIVQLNPAEIISCIPGLLEKLNQLLQLLPPVSIPYTIKSILQVLIVYLTGLRDELRSMIAAAARAAAGALRAAELGNFRLEAIIDCAEGNIDLQFQNLNESIKPLSRLVGVLNFLLELAGLPCITIPLDELTEITDAMLEPINAAIALLQAIHDAIGVPDFTLEALPKSTDKC